MATYELYGDCLIKDDSTLAAFCKCVEENVPYEGNDVVYYDAITEHLDHDIGRTDIDYAELLAKYVDEIGYVLYEADNNFVENFNICFFGEGTRDFFNNLVLWHIKYC